MNKQLTKKQTFRLGQQGFAHSVIPIIAIVIVATVGSYILIKSHAAPLTSETTGDTGVDDASGFQALSSASSAQRQVAHTFYHLDGGDKRLENSVRGLDDAKNKGYKWTDLDAQYVWSDSSKNSRVLINTHWPGTDTDCFADPIGKIAFGTFWGNLTLAQAQRLRSGYGHGKYPPGHQGYKPCAAISNPYEVQTMVYMINQAAKRGLSVELEAKGGSAFSYSSNYKEVFQAAQQATLKYGTQVWVKTLNISGMGGNAGALTRLKAAHDAGFKTLYLNHSGQPVTLTKAQASYVDYWRGAGSSNVVRVAN